MKLKIFKRLFFTTSIVLFIALTFVFILFSVALSNTYTDERSKILSSSCKSVIDVLSYTDSAEAIRVAIDTVVNVNDVDVFLADVNGKVIMCGCESKCNHQQFVIEKNLLYSASTNSKMQLSNLSGIYDEMNYTVINKTITDSGKVVFVASVSPAASVQDLLLMLLGLYALCALLPLIFMFVEI